MNSRRPGLPMTPYPGRGFSLLELVVVIVIIALLATLAVTRLWSLQVEAEKVAMEQVVGSLRSALGIKVADYFVRHDMAGVRSLIGTNPMDRLSEVPNNYRGVLNAAQARHIEAGSWYFDAQAGVLVYRVRNQDAFRGGSGKPAQIRFAIRGVYESRGGHSTNNQDMAGASLVALDAYQWILDNN